MNKSYFSLAVSHAHILKVNSIYIFLKISIQSAIQTQSQLIKNSVFHFKKHIAQLLSDKWKVNEMTLEKHKLLVLNG